LGEQTVVGQVIRISIPGRARIIMDDTARLKRPEGEEDDVDWEDDEDLDEDDDLEDDDFDEDDDFEEDDLDEDDEDLEDDLGDVDEDDLEEDDDPDLKASGKSLMPITLSRASLADACSDPARRPR
jgi:hypothetical protein